MEPPLQNRAAWLPTLITVDVLGWILAGQEEAGAGKGVHNELGNPDATSGEEACGGWQSHLPFY